MPTWCHMFNSTLTGNVKVWFDDLPKETIDSYDDLKKAFLENSLQQKKCIKDPVEIHNIRQRDRESTEEFIWRYKLECRDVKGAPECMKISGFMHGITNPELIKRLHDKIPKLVDEMMRMLKAGKLSHLIKELKQNKGKEQPKVTKKGETFGKDKALAILMVQPWERVARQKIMQSFSPNTKISFPSLDEDEGTEGPMIIEAEIGGHCIHSMYVDSESALEILYEHCFSRLRPEIKNQLMLATTPLIGFSGEIIWLIGKIQLLVTIGDEEHSALAWMNFVVVRSPSPYNGIIGRPGVRKLHAVPSIVYKMLKIPVEGGVITLKSSRLVPLECVMVFEPKGTPSATKPITEERIKVAINPEYPKQIVMIGSTLTKEGRNKLCGLLQHNLDIFSWKPADMTGVLRHIVEHRLNVREGYAYKGYHQIDMAKEDEEKTAFITSQGIFCYTKMPFGLKNAGATYQRLVDKAFHKQIGRNLEVYVDDLVIKSRTEDEIVRDMEEMFKTLREINMKLNPKKCTFGVEEGTFLGYKVNTRGLKVCLDKVDAVLSLPSPKCLKNVQNLNGKLASLNMFLAKSAEKSLPFFKTLKKCTKKSDFHWTTEAEEEFKKMKQLIAELPMLMAPMEKEELIVYLAATNETVSIVLMTEKEAKQMPIYFVSRALRGPELNYTSMEKLVLALVYASKCLKRYFQAQPIIVVMDQPIQQILSRLEVAKRLQKWIEELPKPWILFTDGSSFTDSSGAGLILTNPEGIEFTYALRFRFDVTNNEAKYEALIAGLRIAEQMGVKNLQANVDLRLVANQVNGTYVAKEADMICYLEKVKTLTRSFKAFSIKQIPRSENKKADALRKIASTSFAHLSKQVLVEELKEKSMSEIEILAVTNGLVERANRSLGEGIKARLEARSKNWMEELPHVLWAHRAMIKSSNRDTPFSLTYGTEAVILAEIGMPTLRTAEVDLV
ncbi:reverse transcriptase domain-containing protein [Tanacetum coccineum]